MIFEDFNECLSFLIAILVIYVARFYYEYFTRVNPLPGPFPLPFFGNVLQFFWYGEDTKVFFEHCYKKYGDIFEVQMNGRTIVLNRTEQIEKLMTPSTRHTHLIKRTPENKGIEELGFSKKGIMLNNDYNTWKYNRQFFSQAMLVPKFTSEAIEWTNKIFNEMETYWKNLYLKEDIIKENKNILDFSVWLNLYATDMIIKILTGERSYTMANYFDTLSGKKSSAIVDDSVKFVHALCQLILGFQTFILVPPFLRHYVPFFKQKADSILREKAFIDQRLDEIIKRRRKEVENTPLDMPLPHDMLTAVIIANTARDFNYTKTVGGVALERPMSDTEISGNLIDGFVGGSDTTANSISYIIYYLGHYPDVKKKLVNEIDTVFKGDRTRPITEDDLNKFKYCEAVIKEVSRIFPTVTSIIRTNGKPEEIAGYQWPADTMFRINADAIQHKQDYWEDPDKFNPDRWLVNGFEPVKHSFIMFGGGLRLCPGRKLAMIELICLIALLFRKYEIDLVDLNAPINAFTNAITVCNELLVKVRPRK